MSTWETNIVSANLAAGEEQLLSLLYGLHFPEYKIYKDGTDKVIGFDDKRFNKRILEIKEEKICIIENIYNTFCELRGIDTLSNCNVIEIGPGAGIMANWLSPKIKHLNCVDISKSILDYCKEQNQEHKNISYHLIEGELEFSKIKNIDFVYAQSVFIHLTILDFYLYFQELYNSLNKGALIYIDIIDCDVEEFTLQEDEFQRQLFYLQKEYTKGHIKALYHANSSSALTKTANKLGYELVWSHKSVFSPANISLIYKKVGQSVI